MNELTVCVSHASRALHIATKHPRTKRAVMVQNLEYMPSDRAHKYCEICPARIYRLARYIIRYD